MTSPFDGLSSPSSPPAMGSVASSRATKSRTSRQSWYAGFHSRRWSLIKVAVRNIVELGVDEGVNDPRLLMRRRVNEVFFSTRRHIITRTLVASKQCKQQEAQRHPWDKDSNTHPQGIYFNCSFDLETGYREKDPKISSARVSHNTTLSRVRGGSSSASSGAFRTGCLPR